MNNYKRQYLIVTLTMTYQNILIHEMWFFWCLWQM